MGMKNMLLRRYSSLLSIPFRFQACPTLSKTRDFGSPGDWQATFISGGLFSREGLHACLFAFVSQRMRLGSPGRVFNYHSRPACHLQRHKVA